MRMSTNVLFCDLADEELTPWTLSPWIEQRVADDVACLPDHVRWLMVCVLVNEVGESDQVAANTELGCRKCSRLC